MLRCCSPLQGDTVNVTFWGANPRHNFMVSQCACILQSLRPLQVDLQKCLSLFRASCVHVHVQVQVYMCVHSGFNLLGGGGKLLLQTLKLPQNIFPIAI